MRWDELRCGEVGYGGVGQGEVRSGQVRSIGVCANVHHVKNISNIVTSLAKESSGS